MMRQAIAIVACAISLAACWKDGAPDTMINLDRWKPDTLGMFGPRPSTDAVRIESQPPGAEATMSQGRSCRTPCVLNVPVAEGASITLSLPGYQSQTIPLTIEAEADVPVFDERGEAPHSMPKLRPNPIYAELEVVPPTKPAPAPAKKPAAKPTAATAAQTARPAPPRSLNPDPFPPVPR